MRNWKLLPRTQITTWKSTLRPDLLKSIKVDDIHLSPSPPLSYG